MLFANYFYFFFSSYGNFIFIIFKFFLYPLIVGSTNIQNQKGFVKSFLPIRRFLQTILASFILTAMKFPHNGENTLKIS